MIKWPTVNSLAAPYHKTTEVKGPIQKQGDLLYLVGKNHFELKRSKSLFCFSIHAIKLTENHCSSVCKKADVQYSGPVNEHHITHQFPALPPEWVACRAALQGDYSAIEEILLTEPLDVLLKHDSIWGYTPLHYSVRASDWITTKLIVKNTPDAITVKDRFGNTALHIAAKYKFIAGIHTLLQKKQGVKCLFIKNNEGMYPSCYTIINANPQTTPCLHMMDKPLLSALMTRYPKTVTSIDQKLRYEAKLAISILENKENREMVNYFARVIATMILTMSDTEFEKYRSDVDDFIMRCNFPTSSLINHSNKRALSKTLLYVTRMEGCHTVDIVATLWRIVGNLLCEKDPVTRHRTFMIYEQFELIGRNHQIDPDWHAPVDFPQDFDWLRNGFLGEAEASSSLLQDIRPLKKLSSYYYRQTAHKSIYQNSKEPYLSGISGMCNAFYSIYPLLGIDFNSFTGMRLAEIMAAFNVSIAFHTFKECFDAFYITHIYLDAPKRLKGDFHKNAGVFTQKDSDQLPEKRVHC